MVACRPRRRRTSTGCRRRGVRDAGGVAVRVPAAHASWPRSPRRRWWSHRGARRRALLAHTERTLPVAAVKGWYVIADDDLIFAMSNSAVLGRYPPAAPWYVGSYSESQRRRSTWVRAAHWRNSVCAILFRLTRSHTRPGTPSAAPASRSPAGWRRSSSAPSTAARRVADVLARRAAARARLVEVYTGGAHQMDIEGDMLGFPRRTRGSRSCRCTICTRCSCPSLKVSFAAMRADEARFLQRIAHASLPPTREEGKHGTARAVRRLRVDRTRRRVGAVVGGAHAHQLHRDTLAVAEDTWRRYGCQASGPVQLRRARQAAAALSAFILSNVENERTRRRRSGPIPSTTRTDE